MFNEVAKTLLEFIKLAPRYFIVFGIVTGVLLFANDEWLKRIGLSDFSQDYRPVMGFIFVITVTLFSVSIGADGLAFVKRWWRKRQSRERIINKLHRLNEDEKEILRYYYAKQTRANTLRVDDGIVHELVAEGIIYRSSAMGSLVEGFAHNIGDFAWNYIQEHPQILEGTNNLYRTDKRNWRI